MSGISRAVKRWWWWPTVIAVWIGLAEGMPALWEAGGREAWAWVQAQTDALAWVGVYLSALRAWDGWTVLFGIVILATIVIALQRVWDQLCFITDELSDIREMLADMDYLAAAGREQRMHDLDMEMAEESRRHEDHGIPS